MPLRALALLALVIAASVALSLVFGTQVLAALGLMIGKAKLLAANALAAVAKGAGVWLRAQGVRFARVEIAKRWVYRSLLPLVIGAAGQRRVRALLRHARRAVRRRHDAMMAWYGRQPLALRVATVGLAIAAMLALTATSVGIWVLIFSVQVPVWILAGLGSVGSLIRDYVERAVFKTVVFMKLDRLWAWAEARLPRGLRRAKRRADLKVARTVVKGRRKAIAGAAKLGARLKSAPPQAGPPEG